MAITPGCRSGGSTATDTAVAVDDADVSAVDTPAVETPTAKDDVDAATVDDSLRADTTVGLVGFVEATVELQLTHHEMTAAQDIQRFTHI